MDNAIVQAHNELIELHNRLKEEWKAQQTVEPKGESAKVHNAVLAQTLAETESMSADPAYLHVKAIEGSVQRADDPELVRECLWILFWLAPAYEISVADLEAMAEES